MVEAERVEELMLNDPVFQAVERIQRDHLPPPVPADGRPAPAVQETTGVLVCVLDSKLTITTTSMSALTPVHSLSGGGPAARRKERSERRFSGGMFSWRPQSGPSHCHLR